MNNKEIITDLLLENNILMKKNNRYIEELKEKIQENSLLKISLEKKNEEMKDTESKNELNEEIKKLRSILDIYAEKINSLEKIINAEKNLAVVILNEDEKKFIESKEKIPLSFVIKDNYKGKKIYFNKTFLTENNEYCFISGINGSTLVDRYYSHSNVDILNLFKELLKKLSSRYPKILEYVFFDSYKIQDEQFIFEQAIYFGSEKKYYNSDELKTREVTNIMPLNYIRKEILIVDKYSKYLKVRVQHKTAKLYYYDLNHEYTKLMYEDIRRYFIKKQ